MISIISIDIPEIPEQWVKSTSFPYKEKMESFNTPRRTTAGRTDSKTEICKVTKFLSIFSTSLYLKQLEKPLYQLILSLKLVV